jgi:hypothetical protein
MSNDETLMSDTAGTASRTGRSGLILIGAAVVLIAVGAFFAVSNGWINLGSSAPVRSMDSDFGSLARGMRTDQNWEGKNEYMTGFVKGTGLEIKANTTFFLDRKLIVEKDDPLEFTVTLKGVSSQVKIYAGILAYDGEGKVLKSKNGQIYFYCINNGTPLQNRPGQPGGSELKKTVTLSDLSGYYGLTAPIANARFFIAAQSEDKSFPPVTLEHIKLN